MVRQENMRNKNMTESDGGTTGLFVRLSLNILALFNSDNVKYTQASKMAFICHTVTLKLLCLNAILPSTYP